MKKSSFSEDFLRPVLVLFCICVVVAALLGWVNGITEPIIESNEQAAAEETRKAVLPGAASFTEVDMDLDAYGITGAYKEDSGLGYVMTASYKGYGGDVVVTVGIDNDGTIVGIAADVSTETTGVGSKAGQEAYLAKYKGISGTEVSVDTITGATYSSTAVKDGVTAVMNAYESLK